MATSQPATEANKALRYPIGSPDRDPSPEDRAAHLNAIRTLPETLAAAYQALSPEQLNTPYREGGWTLRQLAHHVADSHLNAFIRTKLALTENWPTIKPYDEKLWAQTADSLGPVEQPLALLVPLHARWSALLDSLDEQSWARGYMHPESGRTTLTQVASLYAWHGRHHTAHALGLRARMGW